MNQKRSLFYSVAFMSKTIVFKKRYHELKIGHFGEIRLADPVFSAVVLPTATDQQITDHLSFTTLSTNLSSHFPVTD